MSKHLDRFAQSPFPEEEPSKPFEQVHDFSFPDKLVPAPPYKTPERLNAEFDKCCTSAAHLFQDRNREYDGAFRKYGLLGVIFELLGVLNRLAPMTIWKSRSEPLVNVKKLRDLFLDLHNYSNMALMLLEENNWDGRNPIYMDGGDHE